jgi:hypothetical protein
MREELDTHVRGVIGGLARAERGKREMRRSGPVGRLGPAAEWARSAARFAAPDWALT